MSLTFAGLDTGDACEHISRVDHLQLALRHSLAHLPQLAGQVLRQRGRPAGAVHLCAASNGQHSLTVAHMPTGPAIVCIAESLYGSSPASHCLTCPVSRSGIRVG